MQLTFRRGELRIGGQGAATQGTGGKDDGNEWMDGLDGRMTWYCHRLLYYGIGLDWYRVVLS